MTVRKETHLFVTNPVIEELFVFIQPNFRKTKRVLSHHVATIGPGKWRAMSKYMPNVGARESFQGASAHPRLNSKTRKSNKRK
jgi:hypothetical protein